MPWKSVFMRVWAIPGLIDPQFFSMSECPLLQYWCVFQRFSIFKISFQNFNFFLCWIACNPLYVCISEDSHWYIFVIFPLHQIPWTSVFMRVSRVLTMQKLMIFLYCQHFFKKIFFSSLSVSMRVSAILYIPTPWKCVNHAKNSHFYHFKILGQIPWKPLFMRVSEDSGFL